MIQTKPLRGCDWALLAFIGLTSFIMLSLIAEDGIEDSGGFVFWIVLAVVWFVWRRGWIQGWRTNKAVAEEELRFQSVQASKRQESNRPYEPYIPPLYRIHVPKKAEWSAQAAAGLIRSLKEKAKEGLVLAIEASATSVDWLVRLDFTDQPDPLTELTHLVRGHYPSAEVEQVTSPPPPLPLYRRYRLMSRTSTLYFDRAVSASTLGKADPLTHLAQAMTSLQPGERLTYEIIVGRAEKPSQEEIEGALTISAFEAGHRYTQSAGYRQDWGEFLVSTGVTWMRNQNLKGQRVLAFSEAETKRHMEKLSQVMYTVAVSLTLDTPQQERLSVLTPLASAVIGLYSGSETQIGEGVEESGTLLNTAWDWQNKTAIQRIVNWADESEQYKYRGQQAETELNRHSFFLTADELATLWHLPHEGFAIPKIQWVDDSVKPLPEKLKTLQKGIVLGKNEADAVRLPDEERTQHAVIIGKTGTGKSSLLHQMIHQDIASGKGVCVIDPHGFLVRDILQTSIPAWRDNEVVVFDLANTNYPPPLNPLYRLGSVSEDIAADMLRGVLEKIYTELALTEMADTLSMALQLIMVEEQPTPLDFIRIFDDERYRDRLLVKLDDFTATHYWQEFTQMSAGEQRKMIRPVLRRVKPFYSNKALRPIACHPHPLDLWQLVKDNRVILVSLAGDERNMNRQDQLFLGAALVSQLQMAVMSHAIQQPPYLLYMDEAQYFVTTALDEMLSEARKQGLGIVLANQYLDQLAGDTLRAVEGTVSTLMAFEVGDTDAKAFAPYLKPSFEAQELVGLGKYRAAVSLRYQNHRQPAFTLETLPPPHPENPAAGEAREAYLRQKSIENFTPMPYSQVLDELRRRYGPDQPIAEETPTSGGDDDNGFEPKAAPPA